MRSALPLLAFVLTLASSAHAQSVSVGGAYTLLSFTGRDRMSSGFGAWLGWDTKADAGLTVGVEASASFFPEDDAVIGRQTLVLAGGRAGVRTGRVGAFTRVRAGVIHGDRRFGAPDTVCIAVFPTPDACLAAATKAAVDLGGTVELYPTRHTVVRGDLGDTLIRFGRTPQDPAWKHNLQVSGGFGVRF